MPEHLSFSICMPVYRGSHVLRAAMESILRQDFYDDVEIIVGDDNPSELADERARTKAIVNAFDDPRIRYVCNEQNLGSARNVMKLAALATKDVLFFMCQDDVLLDGALRKTHDAFSLAPGVGAVTRPYYWFVDDLRRPVRAVLPYDPDRDAVLSLTDGKRAFLKIFESLGQISGLAYRRDCLELPFTDETFTSHIEPFAAILRSHRCVFLKDFTVAVGIVDSQARKVSTIYDRASPTESWLAMYRTVYGAPQFRQPLAWGREHMTTNYVGLVQLKNYAKPGLLWREIRALVRHRPANLCSPAFWFFAIGTTLLPRSVLIPLVDRYKARVHPRFLPASAHENIRALA